jgi:DNA-binding response OmpR family regulator
MSTIIPRQTKHAQGRLLVVDDDLVQRTILGKIAAKLGFDTVTASSFEIASELLRTQSFDVMTLDLSLGERDGIELLGVVAELKLNAMPIIVVSGAEERILYATKRIGVALELSLTRCLTKPLHLENVREALLLSCPDKVVPAGQ